jgi:hypothetical protein
MRCGAVRSTEPGEAADFEVQDRDGAEPPEQAPAAEGALLAAAAVGTVAALRSAPSDRTALFTAHPIYSVTPCASAASRVARTQSELHTETAYKG